MSLISKYQHNWPDDFLKIRSYLLTKLKTFETIEHMGSTSIPGMVAKPIIDLTIIVPEGAMSQTISELALLEYSHQGDLGIIGREAFDYLPPHIDLPCHHLYACYPSNPLIAGTLAFREFLRENDEWCIRLSHLKLELDKRHDSDRQKYMAGKKSMVEEIIKIALQTKSGPLDS